MLSVHCAEPVYSDGSNPDDFQYRGDEFDASFDAMLKTFRDKRKPSTAQSGRC